MLLTTTDTLPQPFTVLGLVEVGFVANPVHKQVFRMRSETSTEESMEWAQNALRERAAKLGADAVIGLRVQSLFGNNCMLMGTAVKLGG